MIYHTITKIQNSKKGGGGVLKIRITAEIWHGSYFNEVQYETEKTFVELP